MKKSILILIIILSINVISSAQAPKKYDLASPLDVPLVLSGTFGELRSNHFHAGIDIKTQGREGLTVHSMDDGYISRINVSPWGYGKAIYITHPNGLISVYGHLQKFNPEIEKYVKAYQYKKERFSVSIYPKENELKISKRDIIAFSGNTGGSGGPHLHFEIRDAKTQTTQNPFNYDYKVADTRAPKINGAYLYSFDNINGNQLSFDNIKLNYNKEKKIFNSNKLSVSAGWVGIGVDSYDKLNGAENKNGIYSVELYKSDTSIFVYKMNSIAFSEQRYINSLIDYSYYKKKSKRIQKLFLEPGNKLSIYSKHINKGFIKIEEGKNYSLKLVVKDYAGNKSIVNINLIGTKAVIKAESKDQTVFEYTKENKFKTDAMIIEVPKNTFYSDINFNYNIKNGIHSIGNRGIPLHKSYLLEIKPEQLTDSLKDKMLIVSVSKKGYKSSIGGKYKNGYMTTKTRSFGKFTTAIDTIAPVIKGINISEGKWMTKERFLKITIKDNLAGIKSFKGNIDGKWVLLEYDPKKSLLKYNFSDIVLEGKKHTFTLEVSDNVGNITEYESSFFK